MDVEIFIKKVKPEITECRILQVEETVNESDMRECEQKEQFKLQRLVNFIVIDVGKNIG